MGVEAERKALFARKDLVEKLSEVAKRRGCSLYNLVNELFEIAVKAEDSGVDLRGFTEREALLVTARRIGFILVLEGLWYEMSELAYLSSRDEVLRSWFEAGVLMAKHYTLSNIRVPLRRFLEDFKNLMWNISDIVVREDGNAVHISIAVPRAPEHYGVLLANLLEGALTTLGYRVHGKEVTRSVVRLKAVRKEAEASG